MDGRGRRHVKAWTWPGRGGAWARVGREGGATEQPDRNTKGVRTTESAGLTTRGVWRLEAGDTSGLGVGAGDCTVIARSRGANASGER